ncbi:uncharacterized protein LOC144106320 [Amblyomma americanum]
MGCANAKAAGIPASGKTDIPLVVTDGSDRPNYINNPLPKVVINGGDVLDNDHDVKTTDAEDKTNGNTDPPGTETFLPPPSPPQEVEFLTPPEPPKDDDKEAVAHSAGETPVDDENHVIDDDYNNSADVNGRRTATDDNGNQLPPNDVTTPEADEPMPDAGNGVVADDPVGNDVDVMSGGVNDDVMPGNDVTTDVVSDAVDRISPGVVSDDPKGKSDAPADANEDDDTAPNDIFIGDGLDYDDSKKADRNHGVHEFIVQDA